MVSIRESDLRDSYIRAHRWAQWIAASSVALGLVLVFAPVAAAHSPAFEVMPAWAVVAWGAFYAFGGGATLYGLMRGHPKYEAAGSALLASAIFTTLLTTLLVFPN